MSKQPYRLSAAEITDNVMGALIGATPITKAYGAAGFGLPTDAVREVVSAMATQWENSMSLTDKALKAVNAVAEKKDRQIAVLAARVNELESMPDEASGPFRGGLTGIILDHVRPAPDGRSRSMDYRPDQWDTRLLPRKPFPPMNGYSHGEPPSPPPG